MSEIEATYNPVPQFIAPMWATDTPMDITLYVSTSISVPSFRKMSPELLVLEEKNFKYGNWSEARDIHTSFAVPKEAQNNATLWAHFFVAQSGSSLDPASPDYDIAKAYYFKRPLSQHLKKKKAKKVRNLIAAKSGEEEVEEEELPSTAPTVASYYHPNFTLSIIPDSGVMAYTQLHPAVRDMIQLERTGAREATGQNSWYYPTLFFNTFWQLRSHMTELNSTVTHLPLNIHMNSLANWKMNLMASMDAGMKQNAEKPPQGAASLTSSGDGSEMEEVKRILLDSNMYLLATTIIVSIFHTIFEMLAFKSDVSHWRNKKDNVGVSVRTILANGKFIAPCQTSHHVFLTIKSIVFMQLIIFLYLIDNTENTSYMILFGQGMGILVEAWKITKSVDVRLRPTAADSTALPWKYLPYTITFEDKHKLSETELKTQEYDQIAFRYMYILAVPLLLAYAAYSLMYESHKSWYSFVITTLVGSVYAYGFLMMVPSLYINYRLKSVAHMPARAMTYKFLNTFIDDLFAFTIKMPTLHRLATLRDDVIFFVYLYQNYKYKVDFTRVNEFGQGGDDEGVDEKLANKPLEAPAGGKVTEETAKEGRDAAKAVEDAAADVTKSSGRAAGAAKKRK